MDIKGGKRMKVPRFLYDDDGNPYEVMVEKHRNGFNLVTFLLDYEDYEGD